MAGQQGDSQPAIAEQKLYKRSKTPPVPGLAQLGCAIHKQRNVALKNMN